MALNFSNPSRSYDASRHCVCLRGCDNAREIAFLADEAVLSRPGPVMGSDGNARYAGALDELMGMDDSFEGRCLDRDVSSHDRNSATPRAR